MAETVYILCAMTSMVCAVLLVRAYRRDRVRLLFWSAVCFVALAANNVLVFVDLVLVPKTDLGLVRSVIALMGLAALLFPLVWDD
jgi:hydrogenase/urease accessory protein HupE